MRSISAGLTAAQKTPTNPYIKAVVSQPVSPYGSYTFDNKGYNGASKRIKNIIQIEEPFGGNCVIRLHNSDKYFASRNLIGYDVTLGFGAVHSGSTYEVSNVPPLFVYDQRDRSDVKGEVTTELYCLDLWWLLAYTAVGGVGTQIQGTVEAGFTLSEIVTGSPSGASGYLVRVGYSSIVVTGVTGTFQVGDTISGATGVVTDVTAVTDMTGLVGALYGRNKTILNIMRDIMHPKITDVVLDSDDPSNNISGTSPLFLANLGDDSRYISRQLLQFSKCVGRMGNDYKLHIMYPDPAAGSVYTYQTQHAFWSQLRERAVIMPNSVVFMNYIPGTGEEGAEHYHGEAQDDYSVAYIDECVSLQVLSTIQSNDEAARFAASWIAQRVNEAHQGGVRAPMNCAQELYDKVSIADSRSGVTVTGRVGRIVRRYHVRQDSGFEQEDEETYEIELTLGGVMSSPGAIGGPPTLDMDNKVLDTDVVDVDLSQKPHTIPVSSFPYAMQGYIVDLKWSSTDRTNATWTSGTVYFKDGTTLSLNAGSYNGLGLDVVTLFYFEEGNSTVQYTTDWTIPMQVGKGLLAMAVAGEADDSKAYIKVSNGREDVINTLVLYANMIITEHIQAGAITADKLTILDEEIPNSDYKFVTGTEKITWEGKVDAYYQTTPPYDTANIGDLWFDTDDGNKPWRLEQGQWKSLQDGDVPLALTNAATAQATADGKITTYYQTYAPSLPKGMGDIWVNTADGNMVYWCTNDYYGDGRGWSWTPTKWNADNIADGNNYHLVTDSEKTGAQRGYSGLNSEGMIVKYVAGTSLEDPWMTGKQAGLYMTKSRFGYWDGGGWSVYIDRWGSGYFKGILYASAIYTDQGTVAHSLFWSNNSILNGYSEQYYVGFIKGRIYSVSAEAVNKTDSNADFYLSIQATDSAGNVVATQRVKAALLSDARAFVNLSFYTGKTDGASSPHVYISIANNCGGTKQFDAWYTTSRML